MIVLFKSLIMFSAVYVVFRVLGKRMMAEMTPMDRVAMIAYGTIAGSTSISPTIPLYAGLLAVLGFAVFAWAAGKLAVSSSSFRQILMGRPRVVVANGQVQERAMAQSGISREDLWMRLREHKVASMADVELAELEPDGKLGLVEIKSSASSSTNPGAHKKTQDAPSSPQ